MKALRIALLFLSILLTVAGCASTSRYIEGQSLSIGLYAPFDGQIYGLDLLEWINGIYVKAGSNTTFAVKRTVISTNDYFGIVHIRERIETELETKKR